MVYSEWKNACGEIYITNLTASVHSSQSNAVGEFKIMLNIADYEKLEIGNITFSGAEYHYPHKFVGTKSDGTEINYTLNSINDVNDIDKLFIDFMCVRKNTAWGVGSAILSFLKIS